MSDDDNEDQARLRVGGTLNGKWTVERLLGVGGMAAVYAARHRNASTAAVKVLHPALSHDASLRSRFLREGYVANTVGHPGAVRVLDDDTAEDGSVFLVMELLEGETVDARAQRKGGRLSVADVLSIADQLLDVLVAAHAKGIIHRDIKPENIFLTHEGRLKVLDFGIARLRDATSASETAAGSAMGTPAFMAPEQALGKTRLLGPATDIWAVGATMFALLTGRYVHDGESANEVLVRAATQPAPPISSIIAGIPTVVASCVDHALAFEIEARWPDATSFQDAVRRAYQELSEGPHGSPPATLADATSNGDDRPSRTDARDRAGGSTEVSLVRTSGAGGDNAVARPQRLIFGGVVLIGAVVLAAVAYAVRSPTDSGGPSSRPNTAAGPASDPPPAALVQSAPTGVVVAPVEPQAPAASVDPAVARPPDGRKPDPRTMQPPQAQPKAPKPASKPASVYDKQD